MARQIEWRAEIMETIHDRVEDAVGYLGPLHAFTLSQVLDKGQWAQEWNLTSHFIPSKHRNRNFRSIDDGKRACQEIVEGFSRWLAS